MKMIVIEALGLHLGYLGSYGNDWVATPNLDRLAVEGVTFDWHFADQPELTPTTPWHERSVGTGCYAFPGRAAPSATTRRPHVVRCDRLAEAIAAAAEHDWLWIEGPSLLPPWNLEDELLDAYFDEDDVEEGLTPWPDPPLAGVALDDAQTVQLQNTYAAAVTMFDAQLRVLTDRLPLEDTLLCVTARSGLPLGEHGMIGTPRPLLHDELVHVPLLLRLPGAAHAGTRIAALTQPIDLLPTFLEALGEAAPPMHGRSLWPLLRGEVDEVRPFAVSGLRIGAEGTWLMRTPEWALHVPIEESGRVPLLFAKPADRWEVNNLYQQQIELAEPMMQTLREFVEQTAGSSLTPDRS
ncbi:MAG TPA: sulfatase-like hydrolase/transferase [Gemmataceae bacterium]|nr:sulfatase-like hydrolase/transferase [Gemmataceae bacterium]